MRAWVTLLTQPNYVPGVRTLQASLRRSGTAYPLVVLLTDAIDADTRQALTADGCLLREARPLRPADGRTDDYANARFAEVWTKLAVFGLTEFDRLVYVDADMLVLQHMDELFDLDLRTDTGVDTIAACHACRCNPNNIATYPASWTPANCFYTDVRDGERSSPAGPEDYLNAGLLVLTPDAAVFAELAAKVAAIGELSGYPFAEQDFLNEHYRGRWRALSYVYNALKTLRFQHPGLWDDAAVKNIHFIIDKPWQRRLEPDERYYALDQLWWDVAADVEPGA